MKDESKTCPSSRFSKGAYLIGIKNEQEEMDMLATPVKITAELYGQMHSSAAGTKPEKTLRVANKCVESGCKQWTGTKCGVIDNVLQSIEEKYLKDQLPECAIRSTCRWYAQRNIEACRACSLVTTYVEHSDENRFFNLGG